MKILNIILLCLVFALHGCVSKDISTSPSNTPSKKVLTTEDSVINAAFKIRYEDIERNLNNLFATPFKDDGSGEFDRKYQAKTKNPLYNPVRHIKTNNTAYNPNKWIEKCWKETGLIKFEKCGKTKNPLYSPNKTITAENPLYDPNEWIYADVVKLQIGYTYEYKAAKRDKITAIPINAN